MTAKIITKFLSNKHNGDGVLSLDFNLYAQDKLKLEMELVGSVNSDVVWEIYSGSEKLDVNDLTRGLKSELFLLKSYAGSRDKPHDFMIVCKNTEGITIAALTISVFATTKITDAYWGTSTEDKIYEASINRNFTAVFKGVGVYNIPLKLDVFFVAKKGEDEKISDLSKVVYIKSFYDLADFYINKDILTNHKMFFLGNTPTIFMEYISNSTKLDLTGNMRDLAIAKAYFIISYGDHILFNGKHENVLLNITFSLKSLNVEEPITSISPVVVSSEEYFTQKYEPCKYEKIFYKHGKGAEIELFDEKKPTKKGKDGKLLNSKVEISVIVPPVRSKNIKDLKIRLESVETDQCSFNEDNKKIAVYDEGSRSEEALPHHGRVINTKNLDEAKIQYTFEKVDEKITVKPSFNYRYDENSAWDFLKNYFLFSTLLDSKDVTQNDLKGFLIGWEAETKGIIDVHRIGLETCRYHKSLYLKTFADVAWAFHFFFNEPHEKIFYNENSTIVPRKGLEAQIKWIQKKNNLITSLTVPVGMAGITDAVQDFALDIVKDMADKYDLAFTAYYDFDEHGKKNSQQIDYAQIYPNAFDILIGSAVTLEILIQIILIILTDGAAAEAFLSRVGTKTSLGALTKTSEILTQTVSKSEILFKNAKYAKMAYNTLSLGKVNYYKGYRFVDNGNAEINPLLEERLEFAPLISGGILVEKTLANFLLDKTPPIRIIDLTQKGLKYLKLGINTYFLTKGRSHKADKALFYPVKVLDRSLTTAKDFILFMGDRALEKIFGVVGEISKEIKADIKLDFWLQINNAESTMNFTNFIGKGSVKDRSSLTIAPSAGLFLQLKISASVKVPVRVMKIINYASEDTQYKEIEADGKLDVTGDIFYRRDYVFSADMKGPTYKDTVHFGGLGGEYDYKVKVKSRRNDDEKNKDILQEPKEFMLVKPFIGSFSEFLLFVNPAEKK